MCRKNGKQKKPKKQSSEIHAKKMARFEIPTKNESRHEQKGSRIINLNELQNYVGQLTAHAIKCNSAIILSGEKRAGLAAVLSCHCSRCNFVIPLNTSRKVVGPRGRLHWEANLAAVWGQMSTGGGLF